MGGKGGACDYRRGGSGFIGKGRNGYTMCIACCGSGSVDTSSGVERTETTGNEG